MIDLRDRKELVLLAGYEFWGEKQERVVETRLGPYIQGSGPGVSSGSHLQWDGQSLEGQSRGETRAGSHFRSLWLCEAGTPGRRWPQMSRQARMATWTGVMPANVGERWPGLAGGPGLCIPFHFSFYTIPTPPPRALWVTGLSLALLVGPTTCWRSGLSGSQLVPCPALDPSSPRTDPAPVPLSLFPSTSCPSSAWALLIS